MDQEFFEAFGNLLIDPDKVVLSTSKLAGWLIVIPIQIASKISELKDTLVMQEAVHVARMLGTSVTANSWVLRRVLKDGWLGKESKVADSDFQFHLRIVADEPFQFILSKYQCWCVISVCQLAHRHPDYKDSNSAKLNRELLEQLESVFSEGILSEAIKRGWDNAFDQVTEKHELNRE